MSIDSLINSKAELTHSSNAKCPIVLSTRVRLARNLNSYAFPGWAKPEVRREIATRCLDAISGLSEMEDSFVVKLDEIGDLEKQILYERHLLSRELIAAPVGSAAVIGKDQSCVVMVNEEDHLRIQVLRNGFHFKRVWNVINALDSAIEEHLDYAFSPEIGYLTACPTNLGTGMRASAMMHLPALTMAQQMEKVIRAVNQLGIAVRGIFGEGSEASGNIFQISNQTTLGENEEEILKRLSAVLHSVIEKENNARAKILESERTKCLDRIGRAYGILKSAYHINSSEAMDKLSLIRFGIDLEIFPENMRANVDRLFIECQPGHVQYSSRSEADANERDRLRATTLRDEFAKVAEPDFNKQK